MQTAKHLPSSLATIASDGIASSTKLEARLAHPPVKSYFTLSTIQLW